MYILHILLKHVLTNVFNQRTTDRNEQWITVLEFDIPEHPFNNNLSSLAKLL